jgi:hypothetical protein
MVCSGAKAPHLPGSIYRSAEALPPPKGTDCGPEALEKDCNDS